MNYTYYRRYQSPRRPQRKQSGFKSFFYLVVFLVLIVLVLRACISVVANRNEEKRDEAVLSLERGSAEVLLWGQDEWEGVADSQIVLEGDSVRTGEDSYVYLTFHNGSGLRLDENSQMVFSECIKDGDDDFISLSLVDGRAWLEKLPKETGTMEILLETDVMNVSAVSADYLVSNLIDDEYVYVMDGQATIEFVDRGATDTVIETAVLNEGYKATMSDEKQRALLSRDNVTLTEPIEDDEFLEDGFVLWNSGLFAKDEDSEDELDEEEEIVDEEDLDEEAEELEVEEEVDDSEDIAGEEEQMDEVESAAQDVEEAEEEDVEIEAEALVIGVSSPSSPITITEDAIAIEGYISSGDASSVYVTWSGNGEAYPLGLYEAGSDNFRYVADVDYLNFAVGENIYTIVAYDEDGNASNIVTVVVTGEF